MMQGVKDGTWLIHNGYEMQSAFITQSGWVPCHPRCRWLQGGSEPSTLRAEYEHLTGLKLVLKTQGA